MKTDDKECFNVSVIFYYLFSPEIYCIFTSVVRAWHYLLILHKLLELLISATVAKGENWKKNVQMGNWEGLFEQQCNCVSRFRVFDHVCRFSLN